MVSRKAFSDLATTNPFASLDTGDHEDSESDFEVVTTLGITEEKETTYAPMPNEYFGNGEWQYVTFRKTKKGYKNGDKADEKAGGESSGKPMTTAVDAKTIEEPKVEMGTKTAEPQSSTGLTKDDTSVTGTESSESTLETLISDKAESSSASASSKDTTGEDTSDIPTPEERGEKPSETCKHASKARKPNKKGRKKDNKKRKTQDTMPHKRFDFAKNELIALALSVCVITCLVLVCLMNFLKASH